VKRADRTVEKEENKKTNYRTKSMRREKVKNKL
jgi:hypothetical protein